jgi:hypothetical protein
MAGPVDEGPGPLIFLVTPAKAGVSGRTGTDLLAEIPACAGMTD